MWPPPSHCTTSLLEEMWCGGSYVLSPFGKISLGVLRTIHFRIATMGMDQAWRQARQEETDKSGCVQNRSGPENRPFRTLFRSPTTSISAALSVTCNRIFAGVCAPLPRSRCETVGNRGKPRAGGGGTGFGRKCPGGNSNG